MYWYVILIVSSNTIVYYTIEQRAQPLVNARFSLPVVPHKAVGEVSRIGNV